MEAGENSLQSLGDETQSALGTNSAQAVRKSCDRCYVQKIKCSRSTRSPTQCQRCERAGLKCVFGRRNPRQAARTKASVPTTPSIPSSQDEVNQPYQPMMEPIIGARGGSSSSGASSLDWLGSFDGSEVGPLPPWSWRDFSGSSNGGFPDVSDQPICSPPVSSTPLAAEEEPDASISGYQSAFERLCMISTTLEDCVKSLTSQQNRENVQNFPIGKVIGTFQEFLGILRIQTPGGKLSMLEGCQQTKTILLASHCYMVCLKIMEALADSFCREMPVHRRQSGTWHPPAADVSGNGSKTDLVVSESFSQLYPLASYLMSACTTLQIGASILSEIEVEFGVPQGSGIAATNTSTAPMAVGGGMTPLESDKMDQKGFSRVFRLLEAMMEGKGGGSEVSTTLQNFQRDHAKIVRLTKQQTSSLLALS
ncbi:hypothetical protein F5X98DRAFT_162531 [Xylaria grammica]|nr:hypothetical protein F5X98DRAFT_162531 [Xylaria grammica]